MSDGMNRVAEDFDKCCDTCTVTLNPDGTVTHEAKCELNRLRAEVASLRSRHAEEMREALAFWLKKAHAWGWSHGHARGYGHADQTEDESLAAFLASQKEGK